jgi:hypothetical protein
MSNRFEFIVVHSRIIAQFSIEVENMSKLVAVHLVFEMIL